MQDEVLDQEEMEEWEEWVPELIEAIELGMLDKHIKIIAKSCYKRRDVLIARRDAKRKARPGGSPASTSTGDENPYRDMELTARDSAVYGSVEYNGAYFSKWDLQNLYANPHRFRYTGTKIDGAEVTLVKVNRTNAVFRIMDIGMSRYRYGRGRLETGDKINVPLELMIREAQQQTINFHSWNNRNGDSNA